MNHVIEFRLIYNLANNSNVYFFKSENTPIPKVGEIVSLDGNPFVVYNIGHAYLPHKDYVYVEVFKAGTYALEIGGVSY